MTRDTEKDFRKHALRIVMEGLESARNDHPLDAFAVFDYKRPTLGGTVPIELYRAIRLLAFREALGSKLAAAVLKVSGRSIGRKMRVTSIPELMQTMESFAVGKLTVESQSDSHVILTSTECATCSGLPNVGETFCHFEAGVIAGALEGVLGESVDAVETKCWGLGDGLCSWEVHTLDNSIAESFEPLELVMTLAEQASSAMNSAYAIRESNRDLRAAYRQLRESERLAKDLTDMVVHDLRVPLTAMMGSIQTFAETMEIVPGSQEATLLQIALSSGDTMMQMINDLLDVSRLEEHKLSLRKRRVYLNELVDEAVNQLSIVIKRKRLKLNVAVTEDLPVVVIDHNRVLRVILNLLSNAIQHTPSGGRISIKVDYSLDHKSIQISISDTGEGIPKSYLKKVFDKFVQVESHRSRKKLSNGLGLTFCKLVIEAHGGSIWVESEMEIGSTFHFTIPVTANL